MQTTLSYQYRADLYCSDCIVQVLNADLRSFGTASTAGTPANRLTTEQHLDSLAEWKTINRDDEYSFDSDDFPKVVTDDQVRYFVTEDFDTDQVSDRCGNCGKFLKAGKDAR